MKKLYLIFAGLGGSFNSVYLRDVVEYPNEDYAKYYARELAVEEYESYGDLHGLRTLETIMEEENVDWEDAYDIWSEELDSLIEYKVIEVSRETFSKYKDDIKEHLSAEQQMSIYKYLNLNSNDILVQEICDEFGWEAKYIVKNIKSLQNKVRAYKEAIDRMKKIINDE